MEIRLDQILLQAINFGILLFVLTKFLYKPILKILEQRADKISAGLTAAQKNIDQQEQLEQTKKQVLKQAEIEASKILDAAKKDAQKTTAELIEKAREDAARLISKEEASFKARLDAQEKALIDRTASLVLKVSKAVLKDTLTSQAQAEILDAQVKALKKISVN